MFRKRVKNDTPNSIISNELTIIPASSSEEEDKNILEDRFSDNDTKTKINNNKDYLYEEIIKKN